MSNSSDQSKQSQIIMPKWAIFIGIFMFIMILAAVLYFQFERYNLIGKAISKGDTTTAALLFSPELSSGLSTLFRIAK